MRRAAETNQPFIPKPYNWKTYGDMNVEFWKKHQDTSLDDAKEMFETSHAEVMAAGCLNSFFKTRRSAAWSFSMRAGVLFFRRLLV